MNRPAITLATGDVIRLEASGAAAGQGARLLLGALVKSGGAGSIYLLDSRPESVAKVYHPDQDLAHYERKLRAMLSLVPELPALVEAGQTLVQVAWPTALVRDPAGRFCGFVMPKLDIAATIELEYMLQERQARAHGLPTGLGARATLAANLCAVVAELHRQQHYLVDMKPVNLRFYKQSLHLAVIDCDGFSVQGEQERHHAPQFTPDYLAPEYHRHGIDPQGEAQQDRFALAVIVFQLLNFGLHPYSGKPLNDRVPTDIPGRIAQRCYPYGRVAHPHMAPSPVSGHAQMPLALRHLFDRAFAGHESARPSAADWAAALKPLAQRATGQLVVCAQNPEHQHFAGLHCAACARASLRQQVVQQQVVQQQVVQQKSRGPAPPAPAPLTKRQRRQQQQRLQQQAQTMAAAQAQVPLQAPVQAPLPVGPPQHVPVTPPLLASAGISVFVWGTRVLWVGLVLLILARCTFGGRTPALQPHPLTPVEATVPAVPTAAPLVLEPRPMPRPKLAAPDLYALLHAAAQGNAAEVHAQKERLFAADLPSQTPPAEKDAEWQAARQHFVNTVSGRDNDPRYFDEILQAAERQHRAHPANTAHAVLYGIYQARHIGRLTRQASPGPALAQARQHMQDAFWRAVQGKPHSPGYWYGLALSCVDEPDPMCAVGAFALAHWLPARGGLAEHDLERLKQLRDAYIGPRKARMNALIARGQVAAQALGGPEVSPEVHALAARALPPAPSDQRTR